MKKVYASSRGKELFKREKSVAKPIVVFSMFIFQNPYACKLKAIFPGSLLKADSFNKNFQSVTIKYQKLPLEMVQKHFLLNFEEKQPLIKRGIETYYSKLLFNMRV